jgi:hypothetical protein
VCIIAAMAVPGITRAEAAPLGSEFRVNSYTPGDQKDPIVATGADGDFVVVWQSNGQDGSGYGIFARLFASSGAPVGGEFQVNAYTLNNQRYPAVAADADGDFVIAWASPQYAPDVNVFARRFSSAGTALATEFQVNLHTVNLQDRASLAMDADGDFVIAWESTGQDGDNSGAFARRFTSAGDPLTAELQVNTYTTNIQNRPRVGADLDGDFVVTWGSLGQDGSVGGSFGRRFSSAGTPLAVEFQINTYTTGLQLQANPALDADGDFVVAFAGVEPDGFSGIFARRFSSAGESQGDVFQVNVRTAFTQSFPAVAAGADGDFVVVWQSDSNHDGFGIGVFARSFSSAGEALATELQVNSYTSNDQRSPSIAMNAGGAFVVAWQSAYQDGSYSGVFAQRFGEPPMMPLDIDGNGSETALTDGLLIVRYLFGLSGSPLVNGVVGAGCSRCDAAAIDAALDALGAILDVDGNGAAAALTDGLLVVRYLFGLRDGALVSGVVGAGCTRCDAPAIQTYIAGLLG